jgi:hypothetical protein
LQQRYTVIGIGNQVLMKSKVHMEIDAEGKIVKVQDKWNGRLPDNTILNVFLPLVELNNSSSGEQMQ